MSSPISNQFQQAANAATNSNKDRISNDKEMFLKLLMAQMTNQDPLNPVEDKEFVAQLAQFTSVEQLMNINTNLEGVGKTLVSQQLSTAASIMGTQVLAKGDEVTLWHDPDGKKDSIITSLYATIPQDLSALSMNVYSMDANGNPSSLVYSKNIGAIRASEIDGRNYWNGTDASGNKLTNGQYVVNFVAQDTNGKKVLVETKSAGLVIGMHTKEDGNHLITLAGGRQVQLNNIEIIELVLNGDNEKNDDNKEPGGDDNKEPGGDDNKD